MKHPLSIAILLLLLSVSSYTQAQVEVVYPEEDPVRLQSTTRPQREAAVSAPDTTGIPFFEDFTNPLVPVDSVHNKTTDPIRVYNYNLHGLQDGDSIVVFRVKGNEGGSSLNKVFRVKKITNFQFDLYTDQALTTPQLGSGISLTYFNWAKMPYDSLNVIIPAYPNPLLWTDNNGGTYINDRYPVEPPSYNVATFDGLNSQGVQYNGSNFNAQGLADNLTSAPIDLSGLTAPDSLYLSFFWQCAGIGEAPESNDYILLEFKDATGNWIEVWRMYGGPTPANSDHFTRANLAIIDPAYLYKGFQFRFKNHGRLSGPFDVWNLDNIYLDTARTNNDVIKDWAVSSGQRSFLKNFSSMPYEHFFSDVTNQFAPTDTLWMINQTSNNGLYDMNVSLYNETNNIRSLIDISADVSNSASTTYATKFTFTLNPSSIPANPGTPQLYNLFYQVKHIDDTDEPMFGKNNYYSTSTVLWDYYAYDDGTPEYAIKTTAGGVLIGNQYQLSPTISDQLTAIDYCFTRNAGADMEGRTVFLTVWNDNSGMPGSIIHQQGLSIQYPDPFYGFVRYDLTTPLNLSANQIFYVGYVQNFTDPLFIGYDASVDRSDKMFFNEGSGWTKYKDVSYHIPGSLMIRPVFDNGQVLTPVVDADDNSFNAIMYPNPADDILYIDGNIAEVIITDLLGRTILSYTSSESGNIQHTINTSSIAEGLYLVRMTSGNGASKTEKLLVK